MSTNSDITDEKLLKLWRDINFSGSYRGVKTFQILLKTDLNIDVSEKRLYNILKNDHIYLIHAKPKRNYLRRKFDLNSYGELIQSDIAYMFEYESFKYFLVIIDCFSNKIYAKALKDKTSQSVLECFKSLLAKFKFDTVTKLETDQGTEFNLIKKYCKENNIIFKYKYGANKAR